MVWVGNTASLCWHNLEGIEMLWRQEIITGKKNFPSFPYESSRKKTITAYQFMLLVMYNQAT
jgi:hypothetical protein